MSEFKWYKGSLHAHTNRTDGDSPPERVWEWHREHGYDFLVIADHNVLTETAVPGGEGGERPILIPGEEITLVLGEAEVPVHVNGIGLEHEVGMARQVTPEIGTTVAETLQTAIDRIREAGGLAQINHPNYKWAFDDRAMGMVEGASLLEIFNAHPITNSFGGAGSPSAEVMWDRLLTRGKRVWGVATDDAHHFTGEFAANRGNPGRGWVVVRAAELSAGAIVDGLKRGEFYSSTGVSLSDVRADGRKLSIEIEPLTNVRFSTVFSGENGQELWRSHGLSARYELSRLDRFVRATVYASHGARAWTQPVFLGEP